MDIEFLTDFDKYMDAHLNDCYIETVFDRHDIYRKQRIDGILTDVKVSHFDIDYIVKFTFKKYNFTFVMDVNEMINACRSGLRGDEFAKIVLDWISKDFCKLIIK